MLYKSLFYHVSFPFLDAPSASCRKMESQAIIHSGLHLLERICFSHFSDVWLMLENLVSWKYVPLKSKRRLKRYISNGLYLNIAYKCLVKIAGHYTFVSSLLEVHLPQYVKEVKRGSTRFWNSNAWNVWPPVMKPGMAMTWPKTYIISWTG
jgi:hypothetical protein